MTSYEIMSLEDYYGTIDGSHSFAFYDFNKMPHWGRKRKTASSQTAIVAADYVAKWTPETNTVSVLCGQKLGPHRFSVEESQYFSLAIAELPTAHVCDNVTAAGLWASRIFRQYISAIDYLRWGICPRYPVNLSDEGIFVLERAFPDMPYGQAATEALGEWAKKMGPFGEAIVELAEKEPLVELDDTQASDFDPAIVSLPSALKTPLLVYAEKIGEPLDFPKLMPAFLSLSFKYLESKEK